MEAEKHSGTQDRQVRLSVLAQAGREELLELWAAMEIDPVCELVRGPEVGLVALRGRMGGGGVPFNFGDATVTRATVRLEDGKIGHAIMLGRDRTKAKIVAVLDALAQDKAMAARIDAEIVEPLQGSIEAADRKKSAETAATKVDFFTMVRGEDE